jgi:hypothetical protein
MSVSESGAVESARNMPLEQFSLSYIQWKQSLNHAWAFTGEISGRALAMA